MNPLQGHPVFHAKNATSEAAWFIKAELIVAIAPPTLLVVSESRSCFEIFAKLRLSNESTN
jgi:hypothetical protein